MFHCNLQLKKLFPESHLKLPGKKFFGNLDPSFHKHRLEGLNEFVQALLNNKKIIEKYESKFKIGLIEKYVFKIIEKYVFKIIEQSVFKIIEKYMSKLTF